MKRRKFLKEDRKLKIMRNNQGLDCLDTREGSSFSFIFKIIDKYNLLFKLSNV